jgi:hypothetical protein
MVNLLLDQNWLWKTEQQLANELKRVADIGNVVVEKSGFLKVDVEVITRPAFAAVHSGGYYVLIDAYGIVLDLTETPEAPYAIEGFHVSSSKIGHLIVTDDLDLIEKAVRLVHLFDQVSESSPNIALIDGDIVQRMTQDITVNFGDATDVEMQFNSAISIYRDMVSKGITRGVINVKNVDQCIVEPNKE